VRYGSQKKPSGDFRKLLLEPIDKSNPRLKLTSEETKRLTRLEGIDDKLRRGENVQNRQLQTWHSEDEFEQVATEWGQEEPQQLVSIIKCFLQLGRRLGQILKDPPRYFCAWN